MGFIYYKLKLNEVRRKKKKKEQKRQRNPHNTEENSYRIVQDKVDEKKQRHEHTRTHTHDV